MSNIDKLKAGFETAYIDGNTVSDVAYLPQFVSNNRSEGKKVLSSLIDELAKCDSFKISVAFITESGLTPLKQILKELEDKNIKKQSLTKKPDAK